MSDPGAGRDVDESIGVRADELVCDITCPRRSPSLGPPPSGGRRRTGQPSPRRLRRRRSSRGRAGPSARTPRRPAGRTRRRLRWPRYPAALVYSTSAGGTSPARRLVDQPPGHDHPRGHLDRRLDRLEPLGVIDDLPAAEERVDPLPRVDAAIGRTPPSARPSRRKRPAASVRAVTAVCVPGSAARTMAPSTGLPDPFRRTTPAIGLVGPAM